MIRYPLHVFSALILLTISASNPCSAYQVDGKTKSAEPPKVERVAELLDLLEEQNRGQERFKDAWSHTLKELIEIGPTAVPDLIAELDKTNDNMMMRCMGFSLRAIGDKRAVPALIRAIPKTLLKPGSDMGLIADDAELAKFMQKHDLDDRDEKQNFGFGRPVREILGAIKKLTGHSMQDEELFHIFLDGTARQKEMKQDLFRRHAEKWAAWWEANAMTHVKDTAYGKVNLPKREPTTEPSVAKGNLQHYRTDSGGSNWMLQPYSDPKADWAVFYDFDTGRVGKLPAKWKGEKNLDAKFAEIEKWATEERFDMMGAEYISPTTGKKHYAIRPLGLKAWELGKERWKMETPDITFESLISEGKAVSGWLLHRDQEKQRFEPEEIATFLFKTSDGTPGLLFVGIEVHDDSLKPGGLAGQGDQELDPVAFHKGRRFAFHYFEELPAKE